MTSSMRSAIRSAAAWAASLSAAAELAASAGVSTMTPLRCHSRRPMPRSAAASLMLFCSSFSNCWRFLPFSTISPSFSSTHGSCTRACAGSESEIAGKAVMPRV